MKKRIENSEKVESEKNQNKSNFQEKFYKYRSLKKYPSISDDEDEEELEEIDSQSQEKVSYLDIFGRPSFRNARKNIMSTEDNVESILVKDKTQEKSEIYDYPVNFFKSFLFTWTRKILKAANTKSQLEISDLGKFSKDLYPDKFLNDIKPVWEKVSKKTKDSPLIKALLYENLVLLINIFVGNIFVCGSETLNVLLYRQVILHLDKDSSDEPLFGLLITMILLLINKFLYNFIFRAYEQYVVSNSFKIIVQLDSLIYDKLLRTSLYANISEGSLINFIQIDAEAFGDFFTYTPATMVLPIQIIFFIYLFFIP